MAGLHVWMNGEAVASWQQVASGSRLTYLASWLASPRARPLSLSLPLLPSGEDHRGHVVSDYFDNLLPDNVEIRNRIRDRFRLRSAGTFELLREIGRDCVGAVQLLPDERAPDDLHEIRSTPLSEGQVADVLRRVTARPMPGQPAGDDGEFRISIAGAQEKTGLLRHDGQWCLPISSLRGLP